MYDLNVVKKNAFSLNGNYIGGVVDRVMDTTIYRKQGNINYTIKNNCIVKRSVYKKLPLIVKKEFISDGFIDNKGYLISDPRLCVIDLEVYKDFQDQVSRVYAAGLMRNGDLPITFYIDKYLDSNKVIYNLLDELFKNIKIPLYIVIIWVVLIVYL